MVSVVVAMAAADHARGLGWTPFHGPDKIALHQSDSQQIHTNLILTEEKSSQAKVTTPKANVPIGTIA